MVWQESSHKELTAQHTTAPRSTTLKHNLLHANPLDHATGTLLGSLTHDSSLRPFGTSGVIQLHPTAAPPLRSASHMRP